MFLITSFIFNTVGELEVPDATDSDILIFFKIIYKHQHPKKYFGKILNLFPSLTTLNFPHLGILRGANF